ncbi:hypothetical protein DOTSEDRAFT_31826 [Dothistroma septosporum NZE10]|uniref:Uncharacterized protein n=1 Tax=Dothistroma septosporum (strain NZE10 / CBS 128990) TaxID=675120 RepID=N1PYQ8_DOTSN|nr:hypothetical protein DOTSEDRAFT_31826 [Dothistroma septosporum NZE10]
MASSEHPLDYYTDITTSADELISQGWHELQGATLVQVSGTYTADDIVERLNALGEDGAKTSLKNRIFVDKKKVHSRMNRALNIVSQDNEVPRAEVQAALDRMRIESGCQERMNGVKGNSKGKRIIVKERSTGSATPSEAALSTLIEAADGTGASAVRTTADRKASAIDTPLLGATKTKERRRGSTDTTSTTERSRGRQVGRGAALQQYVSTARDNAPLWKKTRWQEKAGNRPSEPLTIKEKNHDVMEHVAVTSNEAATKTAILDKNKARTPHRDEAYAVSFRSTAMSLDEARMDDADLKRRVGAGLNRRPESIELEVGLSAEGAANLLILLYRDDGRIAL